MNDWQEGVRRTHAAFGGEGEKSFLCLLCRLIHGSCMMDKPHIEKERREKQKEEKEKAASGRKDEGRRMRE